ncbi:putative ribonuclease H-like domain-containing protein [Tanacetum coccineum]
MMHKRFRMSSMGELTFFLGLQVQQKEDGIFISQDKYVADILKKFDFTTVKAASTPIETNKALNKDEKAEDVDVYLYRSMIGLLMYLTASRPDIMFVVCACARDSPFDLEAFFYSDYARASLDRKSTTGGCHFPWQKVSYGFKSMLDYGFNFMNTKIHIDNEITNETVYKEWEDRMERVATTASSLEAEQDNGNINRTQCMATLNELFLRELIQCQPRDHDGGPIDDLEVFGLRLKVDLGTVSRSWLIVGVFYLVDFSFDLLLTVIKAKDLKLGSEEGSLRLRMRFC